MEAALDSKQPSELTLERFRTDLPVARQAEQPLLGFETLLPTYPTASQRDRNKSERRHFGKMDLWHSIKRLTARLNNAAARKALREANSNLFKDSDIKIFFPAVP